MTTRFSTLICRAVAIGARWALIGSTLTVLQQAQAAAQSAPQLDGLQAEVEQLREGQRRLEKEIEAIKQLLLDRRPAETHDVAVDIERAYFKGDRRAKVTVVEFSDYLCPFCGRYARETFPRIEAEYIRTGKVRYVFRDFPIASIHPAAPKAHEAGHCAGEQGKFWEMHDRLFLNQRAAGAEELRLHADALGLHRERFDECLNAGRYAPQIRQHLEEGKQGTVRGTPTFLLGLTVDGEPSMRATRVIRGAQPYKVFKEAIEALLSETPTSR